MTDTSEYWVKILLEAGVPAGPIYSVDQVFEDPQVEHLGIATNTLELFCLVTQSL